MTSTFTSAKCGVTADDGEQCKRAIHLDDPDAHDFAGAPADPVDGGRSWREWITMVHQVRTILQRDAGPDGVGRQGNVDDWLPAECRDALVEIALAVGLEVQQSQRGTNDPRVIREA